VQAGISSHTYDIDGSYLLELLLDGTDYQTLEHRVTRTPTLDGYCAIVTGGHSDSDRIITIRFRLDPRNSAEDFLTFLKTYNNFVLTLTDGCYDAYIQRVTNTFGEFIIVFLINKVLS
jgi:hypothetical protein